MAVDPDVLRALERAVLDDPANVALRLHLAQLLLAAGRFGTALDHCEHVLDEDPGHAEAAALAAKARERLGGAPGRTGTAKPTGTSTRPWRSGPSPLTCAQWRPRCWRSVDYQVNAAALEAQLVDPDELVGSISRRLTAAIAIGFIGWGLAASAFDAVAPDTVAAFVAVLVALAGLGAALRFRQRQSEALPRRLQRALDGRRWPLIAAAVVTGLLAVAGSSYFGAEEGPRGYWLAAASMIPFGLAATGLLAVRYVRSR